MANDLNQCTFIGRLGKAPESRTFPSGDMVCNFSIAVGSQWKDKNTGEKRESTEWINIVASGPLAKICADYLDKGSQVMISGKLKTRKWQDQSGQDRYATEIRADSMQMLGGKSEGQSNAGYGEREQPRQQRAPQQRQAPAQQRAASGFDDMEDSIPF